ncbi:SagB/ThcOx family dehydrogenase [Pannonibacter sp. SL95]|uniref:SagB/ThcOx family dehydrogenase n=1 Tax=Pannonibacter sp. SL95 TaxID=2995153 RepID=UPI0022728205|nr:SagB/ThcOx family dehydrogenase [Pannonibacter sp. SL95]MCY1708681.1 SagB/ThcOx family dehydrogenase [Pannonibacter sp. SL95]
MPLNLARDAFSEDDGIALKRRTHRRFSGCPIGGNELLGMLSPLRRRLSGKLRYASAGGLYPVQVYLQVRPATDDLAAVSNISPGTYYFQPEEALLYPVAPYGPIPAAAFGDFNAPVAAASSVSLFLVSDLEAIAPLYGVDSLRLSLIETGAMVQLLEEAAADLDIGLCHVGSFDFESYRQTLGLGPNQVLMHTLLAGRAVPTATPAGEASIVDERL